MEFRKASFHGVDVQVSQDGIVRDSQGRQKGQYVHRGYRVFTVRPEGRLRKRVKVHRAVAQAFVSDWDEALYVDHIDRNKFNNCATNLRMVTPKQSRLNYPKYSHATFSKYVGVIEQPRGRKPYRGRVKKDGVSYYTKSFSHEVTAAIYRDMLALLIHGPLAVLNFPERLRREVAAVQTRLHHGLTSVVLVER